MNRRDKAGKLVLIAVSLVFLIIPPAARATFSIVAVDTVTGAVGSAGASCIAGSQMIHDCIESIGAINTQAYYLAANQNNAHNLMLSGLTPDSIISWLVNNDVEGMPIFRQYGVVTLAGGGTSAGFTGEANSPWRGHLTGPGYSIQGNILLDSAVIAGMETAYLNTEGPLEEKLMAALNAADIPGADTRCMSCNKPAISAFIKVIHPGDGETPYLYRYVNNTTCDINPMDSLRLKYDLWKALKYADAGQSQAEITPEIIPSGGIDTAIITVTPLNYAGEPPTEEASVSLANSGNGILSDVNDNGDGTFNAIITAAMTPGYDTITAVVTAGGEVVELNTRPVIWYYLCGDVNATGAVNVLDITYLIKYLYLYGFAPNPSPSGDVNTSGAINILDVTYLINYLYKDGPDPICK
nr:DUF1028 domain-containing protein [candidate division Zixibacteria bacterium]